MDNREICAQLRPKMSMPGFALLIYYGIMNALVMAVLIVQGLFTIMPILLNDSESLMQEAFWETAIDSILNNGWGYLLATAVGAVLLLAWKKKDFFFREIWQRNHAMKPASFFMLLFVFLSAQALAQLMTMGLEWFFNLFDMSVLDSLESMGGSANSVSMLLYMGVAAPIFEEILFRGLVLRSLRPYGKRFAILGSAFLFGIFHGNIIQTPFAFAVGLVLGYVTVEYSMFWAILLHTINNLVVGDILTRVCQLVTPWIGELIFAAVIWGSLLAAVIILIVKRRQVAAYFTGPKIHPLSLKSFFTAPGILVLTGIMILNIISSFLMMLIAQI